MQSFNQGQLISNIAYFLKEISRSARKPADVETLSESDMGGLCAGLSLLMLDADAIDKQDPYIASLCKFNEANQDQLAAMAQLFRKYQPRFKEFIQANKKSLQDSIAHEEQDRTLLINQYKALKEELANIEINPSMGAEQKRVIDEKIAEVQKARNKVEEEISKKRKIHFDRIETEFLAMIKLEMSEEQIPLYQTAKAFYEFSHTLLAASGPTFPMRDEAGYRLTNDDVIETLRLIGAPSAKLLENQFSIFMNLTDAEVEDVFDTVILDDKDKVSLTFQLGHNLYLTKNNNIFRLFDPNANQLIEAPTAKELVTKLREQFLQGFSEDPGEYIAYGIQIFRHKNEPIAGTRPTMEAKLKEILERRKASQDSYATDAPDLGDNSSLHWASSIRNPSQARLLLEYKADPNFQNEMGDSPVHKAATFGRDDLITELHAKHADLEIKDGEGLTPLLVAIKCGATSTARLLLEYKVDPNMTGGKTIDDPKTPESKLYEFVPLIQAVKCTHDELVSDLLEKKANLEMKSIELGLTALLFAAQLGNLPVVKILLEHKAQYDVKDNHDQNLLLSAVLSKNESLVSYLLNEFKQLLDVNCFNDSGQTPLHIAMKYRNWKMASLLLEHRATPFFTGVTHTEVHGIQLAHDAGQFQICARMEYKEKISAAQNQWLKNQITKLFEFKDESKEASADKSRQKLQESIAEIVKSHSDPEIQFYLLKKCLQDHLNDWSYQRRISSLSSLGSLSMLNQEKSPECANPFFNSIYALLKEISNITRINFEIENRVTLERTYALDMIKGFPDPIPRTSPTVTPRV
ncbi:MAG: ankyrin repeat domain-containing protein [Gammaproteobacteria bacterium]